MKAYVKTSNGRDIEVLDTCLGSDVVNTLKHILTLVESIPEVRNSISELRVAFNEGRSCWGAEAYRKYHPNGVPGGDAARGGRRIVMHDGGYFDNSLADCCEPDFEV